MSSRNRRGTSEEVDEAAGALAKEFIVVPIGGMPCCIAENEVLLASAARFVRERVKGDVALRESIDVAGDTPSERYDRLRRFCYITC